jgi:tripartite-type tricarboxylate transporter receptor subunit TctC
VSPLQSFRKNAEAFHAAMKNPNVVSRLAALGATVETDSPAEFQEFITEGRAKWVRLAREARTVPEK